MKNTLESIIIEQPFFHGLDQAHIKLITGCARNVRFDADQVIFREGEDANEFYLIREGSVSVEVIVPHRGSTVVQTVREEEMLGWS